MEVLELGLIGSDWVDSNGLIGAAAAQPLFNTPARGFKIRYTYCSYEYEYEYCTHTVQLILYSIPVQYYEYSYEYCVWF